MSPNLNLEVTSTGEPASEELISEAEALLNYAAGQGETATEVSALCEALRENDKCRLLAAYAALAAKTTPVTGRTLIDSRKGWTQFPGVVALSFVFFLLAIGNEMADAWIADSIDPSVEPVWLPLKRYVWDILTPFFWGGLGSCIYLLKVLWDKQADFEFEKDRFRGWGPRILLGALLGGILQFIVIPSSFASDSLNIGANSMAFFTGIGVKVVYGAIERLIYEAAKRVKIPEEEPKAEGKGG